MDEVVKGIIASGYHLEDYFLEESCNESTKVASVAIESLSLKFNVDSPLTLIIEGPKCIEKKLTDIKVYSPSHQLNLDQEKINEGKRLLKEVNDLKKSYQDNTQSIKETYQTFYSETNFGIYKETLEGHKIDHDTYSLTKKQNEGDFESLKKEATKRVNEDKLQFQQPLQKTVISLASQLNMKTDSVLELLKTYSSNTKKISSSLSDYQTALWELDKVVSNFCYEFCYLCYLCSEKIPHHPTTKGNFYFWYSWYYYNFIDTDLLFNQVGELKKMEAPDKNKPRPPQPSYHILSPRGTDTEETETMTL